MVIFVYVCFQVEYNLSLCICWCELVNFMIFVNCCILGPRQKAANIMGSYIMCEIYCTITGATRLTNLIPSEHFFFKFFLYFSVQLHSLLHSNLNTIVPLTNCHDALLQNFLPSRFFTGMPHLVIVVKSAGKNTTYVLNTVSWVENTKWGGIYTLQQVNRGSK